MESTSNLQDSDASASLEQLVAVASGESGQRTPGAAGDAGTAARRDDSATASICGGPDLTALAAAQRLGPARVPAKGAQHDDSLSCVPDRRTADRLALAITDWAVRQGPSVVDFLYLANAAFGQLPTPEAQANAIESLQACQDSESLRELPSRDRYRLWFGRQPAEMEWASPDSIETACGNWSRAKAAAAGEPLLPVAAAGAGRLGGYLSDEALLELLRQWHADEPDERRRFCCFRAWVLQRLEGSDAGELAGRVISKQTYGKHFGSWAASIARAGLLEGISFAAFKRLVGTPRRYPVDVLERSLDRWARWADDAGRHLTIACLGEWRDEVLKDQWRHGVVDGVPGVGAVASRWGTFLDGLVAVGLISADEALRRRLERGDRLPVEEVAALVRAARREFGGQLSTAAYEDFRARKARELGRSVPSVTTVIDKLAVASFPEAVKVAERFGPTTTAETVDHDEEEL